MTNQDNNSSEQNAEVPANPDLTTRNSIEPPQSGEHSLTCKAAITIALIALFIVTWQWINTRHSIKQLEQSLAVRLEQFSEKNQQTIALAKNADERSAGTAAHTSLLEQKLEESRGQQEALQTLYLELANNREERVVSEVEQLMVIAHQQLQLAGNVKPALLALQTADTRLQQLDTPQVMQIRKVLALDIQKLQSLPLLDNLGMSLKLETLANNIDTLPLVSDRQPANSSALAPDFSSNPWRRLIQEIWQDLRGMIRLERIDHPEAPLLAPDQTFFLRENIKLRLLTARIALLQHDEATYRADLAAAKDWLQSHFDLRESATQSALSEIKELSAGSIVIQMPDINESLGLVSKYKLTLERSTAPDQHDTELHSPAKKTIANQNTTGKTQ